MKAYQCDRCFGYYTKNEAVTVPGASSDKIITGMMLRDSDSDAAAPGFPRKSYDLCDKCAKELVEWLLFKGD